MFWRFLFYTLGIVMLSIQSNAQNSNSGNTIDRVIVFMIDGLHWEAPQKLNMPVFNSLKSQGVYVEKSMMIVPDHPTVGEYGKYNTSSFPNPVLQSGSLFIRPDLKMLQHQFSPKYPTAFFASTNAYASVAKGFLYTMLDPNASDREVVEYSIDAIKKKDFKYMRIHLQQPGNEGRYLSYTTPDKTYFRNIWGKDSPYIQKINEADVLLGKFIEALKSLGKWEKTLFVVTSDQGQANIGWHPVVDADSWTTPLLILGPGIAKGRTLPYFEHTDLTPSIAQLMGVQTPVQDGGSGKFVEALLASHSGNFEHPRYIEKINLQLKTYLQLKAEMQLRAKENVYFSSALTFLENELLTPEPFYSPERFMEWYKAGTTQHLIDANALILEKMRKELAK